MVHAILDCWNYSRLVRDFRQCAALITHIAGWLRRLCRLYKNWIIWWSCNKSLKFRRILEFLDLSIGQLCSKTTIGPFDEIDARKMVWLERGNWEQFLVSFERLTSVRFLLKLAKTLNDYIRFCGKNFDNTNRISLLNDQKAYYLRRLAFQSKRRHIQVQC